MARRAGMRDRAMVAGTGSFLVEMKPLISNVEERMQCLQDDVERTRRELQRLELYHAVVKRLSSPEALMPEVVRAQGLDR